MFIHLHNHSHYSLLDGLIKIDDLISATLKNNMQAVALTDHGVMYGAIEFYEKAKARNVKPIVGVEVYVANNKMTDKRPNIDNRQNHLVLLAKNAIGYKNLIKLTTRAHLDGFYYKPRVDKELLKKHSQGLIALSACLKGEVPQLVVNEQREKATDTARFYNHLFGKDNFYLELQHHPNIPMQASANAGVIEIAKKLNIPLVASNDVHYLNPEDAEAQEILLCLQSKNTLDDKGRALSMLGEDFSFFPPKKMMELFRNTPEAIENTMKIAEKCNLELELGQIKLPAYPVPLGKTSLDYLEILCYRGLSKRYNQKYETCNREIKDRLDYELSVIEKTGFATYFLIVQDFVNWSKSNNIIVGPGRGSAPGSLVSYLLNITDIDPLKHELLFERFLNPERVEMPDIDLDFADTRRDEVIDYVRKKYGSDHVAQIITFGTMAARAVIRDVGRVLNYPYSFCDQIAKLIPMSFSLDRAVDAVPELKKAYKEDEKTKRLIDVAKKLEGVARHASTHACGVLITKDPIDEVSPCQYASASDKTIVSQYELHAITSIGLLKMDFLGLKNLTIIENTLKIIGKIRGEKIDLKTIPLADQETFELLAQAKTTGVFQLESSGMKRYLKELKPTQFEDIIAMVALYRPGPMEWIPKYIQGKHNPREVTYLHPLLQPILEKTYGVAVYQEQLLQMARDLAGFSLGEADILRKAVGKKIAKLLVEQKEKFTNGCVKNGISMKLAEKIFAFIEPFAGYGFNRAHAACYAMVGYQTAYLKAHYPAEFMAALLTSDQDNTDRIAIEVQECLNLGMAVLPPSVNQSFANFTVVKQEKDKEVIRFGLTAVKNVGENIVKEIILERKKNGPFKNLDDFVKRVQSKDLNKKSLESLIKCGALDQFGERNKILGNVDKILKYTREQHRANSSGQRDLFGTIMNQNNINFITLRLDEMPEASKQEKLKWEKELLGLYISYHPLEDYQEYLAYKTIPIKSLNPLQRNDLITLGGILTSIKKITTRKGDPMLFATLEDLTSKMEILVFPTILGQTQSAWEVDKIVLVNGRISDKDGEAKLIAEAVWEITPEKLNHFQSTVKARRIDTNSVFVEKTLPQIQIRLPKSAQRQDLLNLKQILANYPGESSVFLSIPKNEVDFSQQFLKTEFKVNIKEDLTKKLKNYLGDENVQIVN